MKTISIPYTEDLLLVSGISQRELEQELRFLLAVKLFELRRISLGKAAEFCEIGKLFFMKKLGDMGIPIINLDDEQIQDELSDE
ncbi:MAG: UPF0175 family protein [Desulfococcaceae bacterium]